MEVKTVAHYNVTETTPDAGTITLLNLQAANCQTSALTKGLALHIGVRPAGLDEPWGWQSAVPLEVGRERGVLDCVNSIRCATDG